MSNTNINAIIWDYDGTLVDTRQKNMNVTKKIHETDVLCVRAANRRLQENNVQVEIISIGACYDNGADTADWQARPDFEAHRVEDILKIVDKIKSFKLNQRVNYSTIQPSK
jgi:hypothetical protein